MTDWNILFKILPIEVWNTIYMVLMATFFSTLIGFPLGTILTITQKGHLKPQRLINRSLGYLVNIGRSFPFIILMVALIPVTRLIVGTSLGTTAAIVPLTLAAIPFTARMVELSFKEIDRGMIEAAVIMGSSPLQIIYKVMLPETLPSLILGLTTTMINLVGYSAMAGTMGGGGLGKIAIQYGYQRFDITVIAVTVLVLIVIVQIIQWAGDYANGKILKKRGKQCGES